MLDNRRQDFRKTQLAAVMNVVGTIKNGLGSKKYVVAIYLDMKTATDTVDHLKLLELPIIRITGATYIHKWDD